MTRHIPPDSTDVVIQRSELPLEGSQKVAFVHATWTNADGSVGQYWNVLLYCAAGHDYCSISTPRPIELGSLGSLIQAAEEGHACTRQS